METPISYAAQLCSYISSPTKIEKLVEVQFGKGRAPELHIIETMRAKVERNRKSPRGMSLYQQELQREVRRVRQYGPRKPKVKPKPTCEADKIIDLVCRHFMCSREALFSRSIYPAYTSARYVAAKLFHDAGYDREDTGVHMRKDKSRIGKILRDFNDRMNITPGIAKGYEKLRPIVMGEA